MRAQGNQCVHENHTEMLKDSMYYFINGYVEKKVEPVSL